MEKDLTFPSNVGPIDRRQFLYGGLCAGMSIIAPSGVAQAQATNPHNGGLARFGLNGASTTDNLDPSIAEDAHPMMFNAALRNGLTEIDESGKLVPQLAESWESSPDLKRWVFKIRNGVEFHNGKSLTAQDVVATINYHRGPNSKSKVFGLLNTIEDVQADGEDVVIDFHTGNADFPYVLSSVTLVVLPEVDGVADWTSGIGTGGYVLENFEPGVVATATRNPNYWNQGRAHFDGIVLTAINDSNARQTALLTNAVDVINRVEPRMVNLVEQNQDLRVIEIGGTLYYAFGVNTEISPFNNSDVRLALKYAIDRQQFLDLVLHGHGVIADDSPIAPGMRYHAANLRDPHSYDPDKARFYLKKADLSSLTVPLYISSVAFPGAVDAAALYQEAARAAGIEIKLINAPDDSYWSDVWGKKDCWAEWWAGRPIEDWMFSQAFGADSPNNANHWKNERFETLLVQARGELNEDNRRDMYREMQQIVHDDSGTVLPAFANHLMGVSNAIAMNPFQPSSFELDNYKAVERWWFA